ncbi:hypothetical protein ABTE18_21230, partial [Acinetobacter baumannii]
GIALLVTVLAGVSASAGGGAEGDAAGARMAFMIAAIVSLPLIVGAFVIRKPADQIDGAAPVGH